MEHHKDPPTAQDLPRHMDQEIFKDIPMHHPFHPERRGEWKDPAHNPFVNLAAMERALTDIIQKSHEIKDNERSSNIELRIWSQVRDMALRGFVDPVRFDSLKTHPKNRG